MTPTERAVAEVFTDVLRVHDLRAEDDFFDLGGDSLQAVQAALRLQIRFDVDIPLESLEISARIDGVAALIDRLVADTGAAGSP